MPYKKPKIPGVYLMESSINNKQYIGSTINLYRRKYIHLYDLKRNNHDNGHLQNHFNKHGDVFEFSVLEYCEKDKLIEREQHYIDTLNPAFNICKIAGSNLGMNHSDETKKKIGNAHRGKIHSDEYKKKMSDVKKGHEVSDETRKKISKAKRGKKASEEHRRKNSESQKGKKLSEDHKRKLSKAKKRANLRGENHHLYGKPMREEIKLKIAETHKGMKMSDEAKANMRAAWIKRKMLKYKNAI